MYVKEGNLEKLYVVMLKTVQLAGGTSVVLG